MPSLTYDSARVALSRLALCDARNATRYAKLATPDGLTALLDRIEQRRASGRWPVALREAAEETHADDLYAVVMSRLLQARDEGDEELEGELSELIDDDDAMAALAAKLGVPLAESIEMQEGWTAQKTKRGTIKAVGTGAQDGRTLYGKRAEIALRGTREEGKEVETRRDEKTRRAGAAMDVARMVGRFETLTPDHVQALRDNLPSMTRAQIRLANGYLQARLGGARRHAELVGKLNDWLTNDLPKRQAAEEQRAKAEDETLTREPVGEDATSTDKATNTQSAEKNESASIPKYSIDVDKNSIFADGKKRGGFGPPSISAAALKGAGAVWHHQGDPQQVLFNANQKGASEWTKNRADEIKKAYEAGYRFSNHRAGKYGTLWILEKDGKVLTERGAAALKSGGGKVNITGSGMQHRHNVTKHLAAFINSLPETTKNNFGALVAAINRSPLGDHVQIGRDSSGALYVSSKKEGWRLFEPSGGHDASGNYHRSLESSLPRFLAKIEAMANTEMGSNDGDWAVHERSADSLAVSSDKSLSGQSTSPPFTGTDSLGREWVDGKLVAKGDEDGAGEKAVAADAPAATPAADATPDAPTGTPQGEADGAKDQPAAPAQPDPADTIRDDAAAGDAGKAITPEQAAARKWTKNDDGTYTSPNGMVWRKAAAGGEESPVNGKFFVGGSLMPIHGRSNVNVEKGDGTGDVPMDNVGAGGQKEQEGQGRRGGGPAKPREVDPEVQKENAERQRKWDEMNKGTLGKLMWLGDTPNGKAMQRAPIPYGKWKDFVASIGPEGVKRIISTLEPELHGVIDSNLKALRDRGEVISPDTEEWSKNEPKMHADYEVSLLNGKKHEKEFPGSHYARQLIGEMLDPQNTPNVNGVERLHRLESLLSRATGNSSAAAGGPSIDAKQTIRDLAKRHDFAFGMTDTKASPEKRAEHEERAKQINDAFAKLPPDEAKALWAEIEQREGDNVPMPQAVRDAMTPEEHQERQAKRERERAEADARHEANRQASKAKADEFRAHQQKIDAQRAAEDKAREEVSRERAGESGKKEPWEMTAEAYQADHSPTKIASLVGKDAFSFRKELKAAGLEFDPDIKRWVGDESAISGFKAKYPKAKVFLQQTDVENALPIANRHAKYLHQRSVAAALAAGKPVPDEVLADYPDLAAKYGRKTSGQPPTTPPTTPSSPASAPPLPPRPAAKNTETQVDTSTPQRTIGNEGVGNSPTPAKSTGGGKMETKYEAYRRLINEVQSAADSSQADGVNRTVIAAYEIRSKPTTAKFGPHQGKQVVKVYYRPLVDSTAMKGKAGSAGLHYSSGSSREEWVPLEKLEYWSKNAKELLGADSKTTNMIDFEDNPPSGLDSDSIFDFLDAARKAAKDGA